MHAHTLFRAWIHDAAQPVNLPNRLRTSRPFPRTQGGIYLRDLAETLLIQ